jgi:hypothetical protein
MKSTRIWPLVLGLFVAAWALGSSSLAQATQKQGGKPGATSAGTAQPAEPTDDSISIPSAGGGPGGKFMMRDGPGDISTLVREPAVQDELKLSDKQKEKLRDLNSTIDDKRRTAFQSSMRDMMNNGGPGPVDPATREMMARTQAELRTENEQALAQILEPKQTARLKQIALQQEGLLAVTREEIADKINLSIPQREAIHEILDQMREAQMEHARSLTGGTGVMMVQAKGDPKDGPPRPDKETMERIQKLHEGREKIQKSAVQQINKLLSKKQGASFKKLMGEPFDFSKLSAVGQGRPMLPFGPPQGAPGASGPSSTPSDGNPPKNEQPRAPRTKQGRNVRSESGSNR